MTTGMGTMMKQGLGHGEDHNEDEDNGDQTAMRTRQGGGGTDDNDQKMRKIVARMRDDDVRDRTNEGMTTVGVRMASRARGATTTKGRPNTQDDMSTPPHCCEPLLTGQKGGAPDNQEDGG